MRKLPIHPFLIAVYPAALVYADYWEWMPLEKLVRPLIVTACVIAALWILLAILWKSARRGALAASALVLSLFLYRNATPLLWSQPELLRVGVFAAAIAILTLCVTALVSDSGRASMKAAIVATVLYVAVAALMIPISEERVLLATSWIIGAVLVAAFAAGVKNPGRATALFNLGALALVGFLGYRGAVGFMEGVQVFPRSHPEWKPSNKPEIDEPNIYYIVLDGYGRQDALEKTFAFSNKQFLNELRKRGFKIASKSRSNYSQTEQSMASSLNLDYLSSLRVGSTEMKSRTPLTRLIHDNRAAAILKSEGYEYYPLSSGFHGFDQLSNEPTLSDPPGMSLAEAAILERTPDLGLRFGSRIAHRDHRSRIKSLFENLPRRHRGSPVFVVAHVIAPHPPFVFDESGGAVEPDRYYGLWDGLFLSGDLGAKTEYLTQYPRQLQYVNKMLLRAIDEILKSPSKPIIIIQGDHGSRKALSFSSAEVSDLPEAYQNLTAILAPAPVLKAMPDDITPVNSFRLVLGEVFGANMPRLPNKVYYSTWDRPYQFLDVTDRT